MARTREQTAGQPVKQQPRDISPEVPVQPDRYRAGMHLELQKFGDWKGYRQLLLSEATGGDELAQSSAIEVTGLETLTISEDRALSALQILLDRTNYQGNMPGKQTASQSYLWTGILPRLSITYSDYFEAYGLQRLGDGSYYGRQADEALEALESLTRTRRLAYRKQVQPEGKGKAGRPVYRAIVHKGPLITITEGYKELDEQEASEVMAGQDKPQRVTRLLIDFCPLIVDGIDSFYLLKSATLYQEIRAISAGKKGKKVRESRVHSQFIELLQTVDLPVWPIAKDKLIRKLSSLDGYVRQRKASKVEELLQETFEIAQEAGYLLKWEEDAFGILHFTLNPERMARPPRWKPREPGEEEEDEEAGSLPE